jgi:hypothetical protein
VRKFDRSASPDQASRFETLEDFLRFAEGKIRYDAKFHFTNPNGREEWVSTAIACEAVRRLALFLESPEKASSPTLHDGRVIVASHNHASIVQHLRWECGIDHDGRPKHREEGEELAAIRWPLTAKMWFWSNGGAPLEGMHGTFESWQKSLPKERFRMRVPVPMMREVPTAHECEMVSA